jgi:hypothetical protein
LDEHEKQNHYKQQKSVLIYATIQTLYVKGKIFLRSYFLKYTVCKPCKEQRAQHVIDEYFDTFVQSVSLNPKINPVDPET